MSKAKHKQKPPLTLAEEQARKKTCEADNVCFISLTSFDDEEVVKAYMFHQIGPIAVSAEYLGS